MRTQSPQNNEKKIVKIKLCFLIHNIRKKMKKLEIKGVLQLYFFLPATNIMIRSLNI